jgi:chemotaxis protein CheD
MASAPASTSGERRLHVVQGEQAVSRDPQLCLTTILGSCVAACLHDPVAGVGGMNHFLLPGDKAGASGLREGVHAMELLVNALLAQGAARGRLQAKLFGGGRMLDGLTDVGAQNARFAEGFLRAEGIAHVGGSLRGDCARRVQFWPATGRVRQMQLATADRSAFEGERRRPARPAAPVEAGALELF